MKSLTFAIATAALVGAVAPAYSQAFPVVVGIDNSWRQAPSGMAGVGMRRDRQGVRDTGSQMQAIPADPGATLRYAPGYRLIY